MSINIKMRPLSSKIEDQDSLQTLGRASLQIVHDLKNQLNGLKLYATFLRRRMEKNDHPQDEQETVGKLLAGLERAASDLSTLVQFGRPIELKRQRGVDLQKIMRSVTASLVETSATNGSTYGQILLETTENSMIGEFDPVMLADAMKSICIGALRIAQARNASSEVRIDVRHDADKNEALIEWSGLSTLDHDPFASFAGSDEIRMSLAGKIINAHGGLANRNGDTLRVSLPLSD
jgi:light-regulated signal transduction histidine kinase (bacteriophytochrome)